MRLATAWQNGSVQGVTYYNRRSLCLDNDWVLGLITRHAYGLWQATVWNYDTMDWGPEIEHHTLEAAMLSVDKRLVELGWKLLDEHMMALI